MHIVRAYFDEQFRAYPALWHYGALKAAGTDTLVKWHNFLFESLPPGSPAYKPEGLDWGKWDKMVNGATDKVKAAGMTVA